MSTVNLDNCFDDTLLYRFHSVKFFVKDPAGFLRVNCFEIVALPLYIHHNGKCTLGMTSLLRRYFVRTGNCEVSSCPETDIVRKGSSCAGHEISNTLNTRKFHFISCFFLIFFLNSLCRCAACKKSLNHKLKESVLCRKLGAATECCLTDLINCISIFLILSGETYIDMVLSKPFEKAYESGINTYNICAESSVFFFEFKGCTFDRISKNTAGMMLPLTAAVIQDHDRFLRRSLLFIRLESSVGTFRLDTWFLI